MTTTIESRIAPLIATDPRVAVGRFTYGSPQFMLWDDKERIRIGAFCSIASDVVIFGGGEHRLDWVTTFPLRIALGDPKGGQDGHPATKGETKIGNDVWIGFGATIMSGVEIGDGAVIGARSVVSKDVCPYSVVVGNPARSVKRRFTDDQIAALLEIRWWDWSLDKITSCRDQLCSPDLQAFIAAHKHRY